MTTFFEIVVFTYYLITFNRLLEYSVEERKSVEKDRSIAEEGLEEKVDETLAADGGPSTPRYSGGSSSERDTEDELRRYFFTEQKCF